MIRNAYLKKVEKTIHKLDKEIDALGKKIETATAGAKEDLSRQVDALRGKSEIARKKIRGVREAGAETWGRLKQQTEDAVEDVRKELDKVVQKIRKTG
jgi:hypothetical protein